MTHDLRTVVLGAETLGADLVSAVVAADGVRLHGVADHDRQAAADLARRHDVDAVDDCRGALLDPDVELAVIAVEPSQRAALLRVAWERALPVVLAAPPFADFESVVTCAREASPRTMVLRQWAFEPAYERLRNAESWAGRPLNFNAEIQAPLSTSDEWLADGPRAGGGVLLYEAYDAIDMMVALFGMPEEIYAMMTDTAYSRLPADRIVETSMTVMMRFQRQRAATLNCRRAGSRREWRYALAGTDGIAWLNPQGMTIAHADGSKPSTVSLRSPHRFAPAISACAAAIRAGQDVPSQLSEHLPAMAVIQTAYLSARTGQPESPAKLHRIETEPIG
jgi:predicted dehydrogenase